MSGQKLVQLIGECLPVTLIQRRRAAGVDPAGTQRIHKIPHDQTLFDIVNRIQLAARIEGIAAFFHHLRRQGDIGRDHQVACGKPLDDLVVGDVET